MVDGNNFGLNGSYNYTEYEFDSFDSVTPMNSSNAITDWPKFYLGKPLQNVAAVKVLSASIPFTYYTINESNNTFVLEEFDGLSWNVAGTVTIPPGTYTPALLTPELGTAITVVGGANYTAVFDTVTQKYTFSSDGLAPFRFVFGSTGDQAKTNPRLILGFNGGTSDASAPSDLIAPNVAEVDGPPYIYINSRSLGALTELYLPGNGIVNPPQGGADGPQIARVPVNADFGKRILYTDPDSQKWFGLQNTNLNGGLDLYLTLGTADNTEILNLNGGRFCVKLGILQTNLDQTDTMQGLKSSNRAVSRTWPTSGVMQY